jgi:hypothetical protein
LLYALIPSFGKWVRQVLVIALLASRAERVFGKIEFFR